MEILEFTEQNKKRQRRRVWGAWILAVLLAAGMYLCLRDLFGLKIYLGKGALGTFQDGLVNSWNQIADVLGKTNYILLPKFQSADTGNSLILLLFVGYLTLIFWCAIQSKGSWLIFLGYGCAGVLYGMLHVVPQMDTLAVVGIGLLGTWIFVKNPDDSSWRTLCFAGVVVGIIAWIGCVPGVNRVSERPKQVRQFQSKAEEQFEKIYYGENPLHAGACVDASRTNAKEDAMRITMSKPQSLYLRGFVGDQYCKTHWESFSDNIYYEKRDLMYWLSKEGFYPLGQTGQAKMLVQDGKTDGTMELEVLGADRRFAYVPYEICGKLYENNTRGGNFIRKNGMKRFTTYEFPVNENATKDWTDTASKIFVNAEEETIQNYLVQESYYNAYVYEQFTALSREEAALLQSYIGDPGNQEKGHIDYKTAIKGIRSYLEEQFIYTEHAGEVKNGDVLATFLKTKKGYDVHYATAATMMFRYYGIPARYVEGYLLTPQDAEAMKPDQPYTISKERHHAWVEIYVDGLGFVPIEVSPTYRGVMEEADMEIGISNESVHRPFEQQEEQAKEEQLTTSGDEKQQMDIPIRLIMLVVFGIMLALCLVYLLIRLLRLYRKWYHRRKLFFHGEPKRAVSLIYGYMKQKRYPVTEKVRMLGERASYSQEEITEEERKEMIQAWKDAKKEMRKRS